MLEKISTEINPPYGSVTRLSYVFNLFSTHNFSQINSSFLKSRGFSGSDAAQTISSLKFLEIIDKEGNKTDRMTGLQLKGDERTKAILNIVKTAYAKLFDTVGEPNKLTKDELHNDFISIYKLSGRLASTAVPNFLWLCKEAGLEILESADIKERKPRSYNIDQAKTTKRTGSSEISNIHRPELGISVEVGEFELILPKNWDIEKTRQAIVKGEFKTIYDELFKLSPKLTKTEQKQEDAGGA